LFTSRDLVVLRAALMFFDEELSTHGGGAYRPYFPKGPRPDLRAEEVAGLRSRLKAARVRYLCCNAAGTQVVSKRLLPQLSSAKAMATAAGGRVVTVLVLVLPDSESGHELRQTDPQRLGDRFNVSQGYVPLTALDATDVRPVEIAGGGKGFLTVALLLPERADPLSKPLQDVCSPCHHCIQC